MEIKEFFNFGKTLKNNLEDLSMSCSSVSCFSSSTTSKAICSVYKALRSYYLASIGSITLYRHCYVGKNADIYYSELADADDESLIQICKVTSEGTITAGIYDKATKSIRDNYSFGRGSRDNTLVLLALLPQLLEEPEAKRYYEEIQPYLLIEDDSAEWLVGRKKDEFNELLCIMSDNFYQRLRYRQDSAKPVGVKVNEPSGKTYMRIQLKVLDEPTETLAGTAKVFCQKTKSKKATSSVVEYNGKYALEPGRKWTPEEELMIPLIPETYSLPEYIIDAAKTIKASSVFKTPMRNLLLSGPAGTGKTESSRMLCAMLKIPYTKTTCSVDTDIFSLLGQVYPNMGASSPISYATYLKDKGLPTPIDIEFDPSGSYEKLTGSKAPEDVDATECYSMLIAKLLESIREDCSKDKDLVYVESDLIKAVRYGYGHEIQEPTVIKRAGVLVGLNALLENGEGAFITLPTGEVIKKHPNCCIIVTTNTDYEGCGSLNQSVLSRMDIVEIIDNPEKDEIMKRITYKTGFKNRVLSKMADVIEEINKCFVDEQITDGVCGMREFENWVKAVMLECAERGIDAKDEIPSELIYTEALRTVISKASQTEEDRLTVLSVLENTFSK